MESSTLGCKCKRNGPYNVDQANLRKVGEGDGIGGYLILCFHFISIIFFDVFSLSIFKYVTQNSKCNIGFMK